MPTMKRKKTKYAGVYYIEGHAVGSKKPERIFYIVYRKTGKLIEEKAGRQYQDDMTAAKAAMIRGLRIESAQPTNEEQREASRLKANRWTIDRLWDEYKGSKNRLKGLVQDENRFKNYIQPTFGGKEPGEIHPLDIDRIRIRLLKKKSPGTVKNILELLRRIIHFGVKKNLCPPLGFIIEMPKTFNLRTEDLTPDQLKNLLTAIENDTDTQAGDLMKLALYTGMRRGELFRLKWNDIDQNKGFIILRDPKGGIDQRIPLNDSARHLLEKHPRTKSAFVFPGRDGNQRTDIKRAANRIKGNAGLPKEFRALHGLRHTYASMLASSGQVDMFTLQKLLTHKSPIMTQRYAHLRDDALKQAAALAGDIIKRAEQIPKLTKVKGGA
jgi:integrase